MATFTEKQMGWMDQMIKDQIAWAEGVKGVLPEELLSYEHGLRIGWIQCIATLKLQGVLK